MQPVLKLLLAPDGEELRTLVIKEAIRVNEAVVLGTVVDTYNSAPSFMRNLVFNGNGTGALSMSAAEFESMMELRDQVYRIWGLLRSSENFDPSLLQPILQVSKPYLWSSLVTTVEKNIKRRRHIEDVINATMICATSNISFLLVLMSFSVLFINIFWMVDIFSSKYVGWLMYTHTLYLLLKLIVCIGFKVA